MSIGIDQPYLIRLASATGYNWMASLAPLRAYMTQLASSQPRKACCGRGTRPNPGQGVFAAVLAHPKFMQDLKRLREKLGQTLIVNLPGLRTTL